MPNTLARVLLQRCETILKHKIPEWKYPNAEFLREEVLGRFAVILASEGCGDDPDELDFYECRFNNCISLVANRFDTERRGAAKAVQTISSAFIRFG